MSTAPNTLSIFHDAQWADPALVSLRKVAAHVVTVLAPHSSAVSLRSRLYGAVFLKWLCDQGANGERSLAVPGLSWRGFLQRARENKLYEALRELGPDYQDLLTRAFFLRTETMVDPSLVQCLSDLSQLDLGPYTDMEPVLHVLNEVLSVSERMPEHGQDRDTPPGVARLLTELLELQPGMRVCDPTCGAGSLLFACAQRLRDAGARIADIDLAGQDESPQNWATCSIKLLLLGVKGARIEQGDVLRDPKLICGDRLLRFDRVIADIPFGKANWGQQECFADPWCRFAYGRPPASKGDFAFLQHMLASLNEDGKLAAVLPIGAMSRKASEANIRARLLAEDVIEAVIEIPSDTFAEKSTKAVILVANRRKQPSRKGRVLLIEPLPVLAAGAASGSAWIADAVRQFAGPEDQVRAVAVDEILAPAYDLRPSLYLQRSHNEREGIVEALLDDLAQLDEQRTTAAAKMYEMLNRQRS